MSFFGPVTRILGMPVLVRLFLILFLVEAVFLAESFTSLLEGALKYDGNPTDMGWLLVMKLPRIMDLALALGMLIAVYFGVSDARNRGELIILATAGVRWTRVVGFGLCFGSAGGIFSLIVAGFVLPHAEYSERITFAQLRSEYLTEQIINTGPRDTLQTIDGVTFIATPPSTANSDRGQLFFFQPDPDGTWQAGQSQDWSIEGPDINGAHNLVLHSLTAYNSPKRDGAGNRGAINVFNVQNAQMGFSLASIVPVPNQTRSRAERIFALSAEDAKRLSGAATRALLVVFAALVALVCVVAGGRGFGRYLALPFGALVVMVFDVAGRTIVTDAVLVVHPALLVPVVILAYVAVPLAYLGWQKEALMAPTGGRA